MDRGVREPLPARRYGYTQKARIGGRTVYLHTGQYVGGRLGEIFLDAGTQDPEFTETLSRLALRVSEDLQHGVPLEKLVEEFVGTKSDQGGVVEDHGRIRQAGSVEDLIFRDLAITYLGRNDLGDYESDSCEDCGQLMVVRNGTCRICMNCGATWGCS